MTKQIIFFDIDETLWHNYICIEKNQSISEEYQQFLETQGESWFRLIHTKNPSWQDQICVIKDLDTIKTFFKSVNCEYENNKFFEIGFVTHGVYGFEFFLNTLKTHFGLNEIINSLVSKKIINKELYKNRKSIYDESSYSKGEVIKARVNRKINNGENISAIYFVDDMVSNLMDVEKYLKTLKNNIELTLIYSLPRLPIILELIPTIAKGYVPSEVLNEVNIDYNNRKKARLSKNNIKVKLLNGVPITEQDSRIDELEQRLLLFRKAYLPSSMPIGDARIPNININNKKVLTL